MNKKNFLEIIKNKKKQATVIMFVVMIVVIGVTLAIYNETGAVRNGMKKLDMKGTTVVGKEQGSRLPVAVVSGAAPARMQSYLPKSDLVIKGRVVGMEYYMDDRDAWARLQVKVEKVLKGRVRKEKKIYIYVPEGYRADAVNEKEVVEIAENKLGIHQKGEESYYALNRENGKSLFEKGSYTRSANSDSEYRYISADKKYKVADEKDYGEYTEEALCKKLKSYIK